MTAAETSIAPAHESITEGHVLECLQQATIRELAAAWDPGAFRGDNAPDSFKCPGCRTASGATVLDGWRWCCTWCVGGAGTTTGGQATRLALRRVVAEDYEACLRLVKSVAGPGVRKVGRS